MEEFKHLFFILCACYKFPERFINFKVKVWQEECIYSSLSFKKLFSFDAFASLMVGSPG